MQHLSTGMLSIAKLHAGESIIESVEAVLRETFTRSAILQFGLGSVAAVEFGVLPTEGPHRRHALKGPLELVALSGLIVGKASGGPYSSHLHVAVASADGTVRGGHLFSATVGLVVEVGLVPLHDSRLRRVRDPKREVDILEF